MAGSAIDRVMEVRSWLVGASGTRLLLISLCGAGLLATGVREILRASAQWLVRAAAKQYRYEPFVDATAEIRLLMVPERSLWRRLRGQAPQYCIQRYRVSESPEYDAISYTWGSGGKSHRITVSDGVGKPLGELAVTANVRHILRQLESGKGPRYVWIDSVCINQYDNIEKAAQVTHMGTFYSRAARVLICLDQVGSPPVRLKKVVLLLEKLRNYAKKDLPKRDILSDKVAVGSRSEFSALLRLATHPYWRRVWIIQEVINSQKAYILSDGTTVSWDRFIRLLYASQSDIALHILARQQILTSQRQHAWISINLNQIMLLGNLRNTRQRRWTLEALLSLTYGSLATDSRDKIYALYGVVSGLSKSARDSIPPDIMPDYTISTNQLFTRTARHFYESGDTGVVITRAGIGYPRLIDTLPSWVPDWTRLPDTVPVGPSSTAQYRAGGREPLQVSFSGPEESMLVLKGCPAGRIQCLTAVACPSFLTALSVQGDTSDDRLDIPAYYKAVIELISSHLPEEKILRLLLPAGSGKPGPADDTLWRTLITDRHILETGADQSHPEEQRQVWPANPKYGAIFQTFHSVVMFGFKEPSAALDAHRKDVSLALNEFSRVMSGASGLSFALMEDGGMAMVPPGSRPGDEIFIVVGAKSPVILRQVTKEAEQTNTSLYQLVGGNAYIHGMMNGEGLGDSEVQTVNVV